jgi:hypothetical protein
MIVRRVTYTCKTGKDMMKWIKANSQWLRGVDGMRRVEFIRSRDNPEVWGAYFYFNELKDLETYKSSGPYKDIVKSLSEYADMKKPIVDEVFDYLEV